MRHLWTENYQAHEVYIHTSQTVRENNKKTPKFIKLEQAKQKGEIGFVQLYSKCKLEKDIFPWWIRQGNKEKKMEISLWNSFTTFILNLINIHC